MSNNSYINEQIFNETIYLSYKELNKNINDILKNKLKEKIENKCYKNGYIIKGNINIINKTLGKLINVDSENKLIYNIKFSAKILELNINDVIDCYINNINKMGILAYIKLKDILSNYKEGNTFNDSPLVIIIPSQLIEDIDKESIGLEKKIRVKINAVRLKFNANKIQIIGEIID